MVLSILHHLRMPCIFVTCFSCWAHYFGLLGKVTWCGPVCAGHVFLPHQHEAGQLVLWKHSIQCLNRGSYLYENWESESCSSSAKWRDGVVNACQLFFSSPLLPSLSFLGNPRELLTWCVWVDKWSLLGREFQGHLYLFYWNTIYSASGLTESSTEGSALECRNSHRTS